MKPPALRLVVISSPNLVMVVLFYSLALHLRLHLGDWPQSIGEEGFPSGLRLHAEIAWRFCSAWVFLSVLLVPIGMICCVVATNLRHQLRFFALYAAGWFLSVGLMAIAPRPFLNWWWD